jgi:hypothetical protein
VRATLRRTPLLWERVVPPQVGRGEVSLRIEANAARPSPGKGSPGNGSSRLLTDEDAGPTRPLV